MRNYCLVDCFFSSRRRHTRSDRDWSSDVCSSDLIQDWKISFGRSIPRNNEYAAWPHVSREIQGRLTQASDLTGLENVSPGKNIQFIPYTSFRSFRFLDVDALPPEFIT